MLGCLVLPEEAQRALAWFCTSLQKEPYWGAETPITPHDIQVLDKDGEKQKTPAQIIVK